MRALVLLVALTAFGLLTVFAEGKSVTVDVHADPLARFSAGIPGFGYADDPVVGGEEAVLRYRHAGAWVLRTKVCDDATLKFLCANDIRIVLVLDDSPAKALADLERIAKGASRSALAGFQLGSAPADSSTAGRWSGVLKSLKRSFPNIPVAVPFADGDAKVLDRIIGKSSPVTHVAVDLTGVSAPWRRLKELGALKRRLWVLAPGKAPAAIPRNEEHLWAMHWLMEAYGFGSVDAVFFNRKVADDAFGRTMRYLASVLKVATITIHRGEANTLKDGVVPLGETAPKASVSVDWLEDDDALDEGGTEAAQEVEVQPDPQVGAAFAAGKGGGLEFLMLENPRIRVKRVKGMLCAVGFIAVNSGDKEVSFSVILKGAGFSVPVCRRIFLDRKSGKMSFSAYGGLHPYGSPYVVKIPPGGIVCDLIQI